MKVYCFDYSGKYIQEIDADLDQITERKRASIQDENKKPPQVWLIPANATTLKPELIEGHEAFFNGSAWENKPIVIPPKEKPRKLTYKEKRASEYPRPEEYLDGFVKSKSPDPAIANEGLAQIDKYVADCLAVKKKYPKDQG